MTKVLTKKRESLGELQALLKKATKNVQTAQRRLEAAQSLLDRSLNHHINIKKQLDDAIVQVRNSNRV